MGKRRRKYGTRLSPSGAHRWFNCPGSVNLCKDIERDSSQAAERGTGAHALGEETLRTKQPEVSETMIGEEIFFVYNGESTSIVVDDEVRINVNVYVHRMMEHIRNFISTGRKPKLYLERRLQFAHVRANMTQGMADAIIDAEDTIVVCDFKFGFIPVPLIEHPEKLPDYAAAKINPQLLIYAAGVAHDFDWLPKHYVLEIVQPRALEVAPVQSVTIPAQWLDEWSDNELWSAACNTEMSDAPLVTGVWCRFCPALAICPAMAKEAQRVAEMDFSSVVSGHPVCVGAIKDEQLIEILRWAPILDAWLREVNELAFQKAMSGVAIPGYKLVRGRSSRDWPFPTYEDGIFQIAKELGALNNIDETLPPQPEYYELVKKITEPLTLKSPAQLEKLGKEFKEIAKKFAKRTEGNLTLAVESDRRSAVAPVAEFSEFAADKES